MTDPQFPHSYKELHGAPYDDDPGPWPYLTVIAFAALSAVAILITTIFALVILASHL